MSLPEPEIGQIWADTYLSGNGVPGKWKVISRSTKWPLIWDVESIDRPKRPNNMLHSDSVNGPNKSNHIYYVGDKDNKDAPNPNYKPEPAAGQAWMLSGTILKLKEFVPCPDTWIHETGFLTGFSSFKAHEISFIGWYDTSLLVTVPSVDLKRYPHKCPCGAAAYIGFNSIDCSKRCRK